MAWRSVCMAGAPHGIRRGRQRRHRDVSGRDWYEPIWVANFTVHGTTFDGSVEEARLLPRGTSGRRFFHALPRIDEGSATLFATFRRKPEPSHSRRPSAKASTRSIVRTIVVVCYQRLSRQRTCRSSILRALCATISVAEAECSKAISRSREKSPSEIGGRGGRNARLSQIA
jgi:hypothetical protein